MRIFDGGQKRNTTPFLPEPGRVVKPAITAPVESPFRATAASTVLPPEPRSALLALRAQSVKGRPPLRPPLVRPARSAPTD